MDQRKWTRDLLIFGASVYCLIAIAFTVGTYQAADDDFSRTLGHAKAAAAAWKPALGMLLQFAVGFAVFAAVIFAMRWMNRDRS